MKYIIFWLFVSSSAVFAQSLISAPQLTLDTYQNPTSIEWKSLTSDHFEIIFPVELEEEAQLVSATLETLYGPVASGLKVLPRQIPIVLQSQTMVSNGFVTLAPRRSEFFTTPMTGPGVGQSEWLRTLAVHEFRHVVQFEKSREGFAKVLRWVLGEIGTGLAIVLTLPPWYTEGDAVGTETALSLGGRGRLPYFERDLRALLLDGQKFTYDQMALGSYERYRPNHYVFGYFFTTYLRKHYGADILEKAHKQAMEAAYNPLSFIHGIERTIGRDFEDLYRDCLKELQELWKKQAQTITSTLPPLWYTPAGSDWVNYSYSAKDKNHGNIVAYKESLSHIGHFVQIDSKGEETKLWTPSPMPHPFPLKIRAGRVTYSETSLDPRWGNKDYSKIVVRNVTDGKLIWEDKGFGLMPTLSEDGRKVAYFEWLPLGKASIQVMDIHSDKKLHRFPWDKRKPVMGMDWIPGAPELVVLYKEGVYRFVMAKLSLLTGELTPIASTDKWNWAYPSASSTHVYFQSPASGLDNIHRISLDTGVEEQVSDDSVGAYHPSVNDEELTYGRYTAKGMRPVSIPLKELKVYATTPDSHVAYFDSLIQQEGKGDLLSGKTSTELKSEDYSQFKNALNPHSWVLLAPPFVPFVIAQLDSTNILNTFEWLNGAQWNLNERALQGFTTLRWSYLWPLFDFGAAFGGRREKFDDDEEDYWEEASTELGMLLPWRGVHGAWYSSLGVRPYGSLLKSHGRTHFTRGELNDGSIREVGGEAFAHWQHRSSLRDLLPPWGVSLQGKLSSAQYDDSRGPLSFQRYGSARVFTSPTFKHHHLYGEYATETQAMDGYHFYSPVMFSRGYSGMFLEEQYKTSANYAFPLFYPEWSLGRFVYLKRIAVNGFYDNLWGRRYGVQRRFESAGGELWFDTHILRVAYSLQWGVRYSIPTDKRQDPSAELFLNTGVLAW